MVGISPRYTQLRSLSLFGNLGQSVRGVVPKDHVFFKVKRPIGVKDQPKHVEKVKRESLVTTVAQTPRNIWNFYFDGITRKTRVHKIQQEMAYGGMYDFHVYNKTKGRLFEAPVSYFRRDRALFFPNFRARTLTGGSRELLDVFQNARATVLRVYSSQTGATATEPYFKVPDSDESYLTNEGSAVFWQSFPEAQIVELVLSESWIKYAMYTRLSAGKLRALRPDSQHERFLIAERDKVLPRDLRNQLLMTNLYSGYVYVVDKSGRIRWVGSGLPENPEVEGLWKSVRGICKEVSTTK